MFISSTIWSQESLPTALEPIQQELSIEDNCEDEIEIDTMIYEEELDMFETSLDGHLVTAMITDDGDTIYMDRLRDISITSLRKFKSDADYQKYMKFKRYAAVVYPYAREAIKIFKETEHATLTMKKRKRKKHIKKLQKDLNEKFEKPLTKLTKLQGKILIKMIERELDKNMFTLIASLRGKLQAIYWHNASKLYSYDLKEGYEEGKYEILDAVLQDFDISYRIEQDDLKNKN